jgi:Flp pilus assembly protein TadG
MNACYLAEDLSMTGEKAEKKDWKRQSLTGIAGRLFGNKGASLLELALLLPILVVLAFGVIDFGHLIHARLVVTNVSREGGSLASRDIKSGTDLIAMLQSSATPFDLQNQGKIYIYKIKAGDSAADPLPYIDSKFSGGAYSASSSITGNVGDTPTGLSTTLFNHLRYNSANKTSDISEISVVEVFYLYTPITPLPRFITNLVLPTSTGIPIGSKAIF